MSRPQKLPVPDATIASDPAVTKREPADSTSPYTTRRLCNFEKLHQLGSTQKFLPEFKCLVTGCCAQSTCTAWNFQASGQPAYDGTPSGACQLVSGTKGTSDTLASGSGQPFIGGVLAKTSP